MKQILLLCAMMCTLGINAKVRLLEMPDMVYSNTPATVKGTIKGYTTTNKEAVLIQYVDFEASSMQTVNATISTMSPGKASDATFECEVPIKFTDRVTLSFRDKSFVILLVPGEETGITIDMKQLYAENTKKPALTFTGSLADFNDDFVQYAGEYDSSAPFASLTDDAVTGLTPDQYKSRMMDAYMAATKKLNSDKRLCGAFKQYVNATYQYHMVVNLYTFPRRKQAASGNNEAVTLPDNYFANVKEWQPFENNAMLYAFTTASQVLTLAQSLGKATIGESFAMPKSSRQLQTAYACKAQLSNSIPLTDQLKADLNANCPVLKDAILKANDALLAHIEENRRNPQFFVKDFDPSLEGEAIFKALIAPYKGKPLLVDFWATWCGPCKAAMKTILPVKEELKGKVNFIYLTGPTSPKDAWEAQIPDIHGDHYYVTAEQYSALLKQFESQGIPTYVVVDKDGNIVAKHIGYPGNDVIKEELSK